MVGRQEEEHNRGGDRQPEDQSAAARAEDTAHRPHSVRQVQRPVAERHDLVDPTRRAGRRMAYGGVRQTLNDQPPERERQLAQPRQLNTGAAGEHVVD